MLLGAGEEGGLEREPLLEEEAVGDLQSGRFGVARRGSGLPGGDGALEITDGGERRRSFQVEGLGDLRRGAPDAARSRHRQRRCHAVGRQDDVPRRLSSYQVEPESACGGGRGKAPAMGRGVLSSRCLVGACQTARGADYECQDAGAENDDAHPRGEIR